MSHRIEQQSTRDTFPIQGRETLASPELWRLNIAGIVIAGPSGTGKTTVAEALAKMYGISPERMQKVGNKFRELFAGPMFEHAPRDVSFDREIDNATKVFLQTATKANPLILEARLGPIIRSEMRWEESTSGIATISKLDSPIVTILFTAPIEQRARRIQKRQFNVTPTPTRATIQEMTRKREIDDMIQWKKVHPILEHIDDPFDAELEDGSGKPVYDLVVHTGHRTATQVIRFIEKWLKKNHYVDPEIPTKKAA